MKFNIIPMEQPDNQNINPFFIVFDIPKWLEHKVGNDIIGPELRAFWIPNDIYDNEYEVGIFFTYKNEYTLESVKKTLCATGLTYDKLLFVKEDNEQ